MNMNQFKRYIAETKPDQGEMLKSKIPEKRKIQFVIPLSKANKLTTEIAARNTKDGGRSPSPGTSTNFVVRTPVKKPPKAYPGAKELADALSEVPDGPETLTRDKEVYDFHEPVEIRLRSKKLPDSDIRGTVPSETELEGNRHIINHQLDQTKNVPRNMMEIAKERRKPVIEDEDEDEDDDNEEDT
jgi:hypothetical protein